MTNGRKYFRIRCLSILQYILVAFCNTFDLHQAIISLENQFSVFLRVAVLSKEIKFQDIQHFSIDGLLQNEYKHCGARKIACVVVVCLILLFTSYQQSFSYTGTGLPGLNQY